MKLESDLQFAARADVPAACWRGKRLGALSLRSGYWSGSRTQLLRLLVLSVVYAPPTGTCGRLPRSHRLSIRSVGAQILSAGCGLLEKAGAKWAG